MRHALKCCLLGATCAWATISCAARPAPEPRPAAPAFLGFSPAALDTISPVLAAFIDSARVGGIHALVVRHGQVVREWTLGWRDVARGEPLRRDDVFRIYSMTKPIVAVGVLRLVDQGRLRLDDPVSKYIPSFANVRVFAGGTADAPVLAVPASPLTIRQLLNHTSGLAYGLTAAPADTIFNRAQLYRADRPLAVFVDLLAALPLLFQPGTGWSYGAGFDVAGRVIEVVSGTALDAFLEAEIFGPLGMRDTAFRIRPGMRDRLVTTYAPNADGTLAPVPPGGLMAMFEPDARFLWGSGGLLSTPDDFMRFARMLLGGGVLDGVRILRPETVALMTRNTLPASLTPVEYRSLDDPTYGFGLGVAVKVDTAGATRPGPGGLFRWSGYLGTYFWVDPTNDLIAMAWTQLSPGGAVPLDATFQRLVYAALAW